MATWVRSGTGSDIVAGANVAVAGSIALDNGTAPGDFDPAGVTSVRLQWSIDGSDTGWVDDSWTHLRDARLADAQIGNVAAAVNATFASGLTTENDAVDQTDNSPNTGLTQAQWEAMALWGGDLDAETDHTTYQKTKGNDTVTMTLAVASVTVTITYTPGVPGDPDLTQRTHRTGTPARVPTPPRSRFTRPDVVVTPPAGAEPVRRETSSGSDPSTSASYTVALDDGAAVEGDLAIIHLLASSSTGPVTDPGGIPSGWTQIFNRAHVDYSYWCGWKILTASDISTPTAIFGFDNAAYHVHQIDIIEIDTFDDTTPVDVSDEDFPASTTTASPAVTTTGLNRLLLIYAGEDLSVSTADWTIDSGTQNLDGVLGTEQLHIAGFEDPAPTATLYTRTVTTDQAGQDLHGIMLAVTPAPVVAGGLPEVHSTGLPARQPVLTLTRFVRPTVSGVITGTLAVTQDDQTSVASGKVGVQGTLAVTQAAQTSAASGKVGVSGSLTETQDDQTSAASGESKIVGTLGVTQADQTSAAAGESKIVGSLAEIQADQTSAASGQIGVQGTVAVTQADQTVVATGTVSTYLTQLIYKTGLPARLPIPPVTRLIQPETSEIVTGSLAETQDDQTIIASGIVTTIGTLAVTQDDQVSAASGESKIVGSLAITQADQTSTAIGESKIIGTLSVIQEDQTSTASGSYKTDGSLSVTQDEQTVVASGVVWVIGSTAVTQDDQTSTGTGEFKILGSVNITQEDQTVVASGTTSADVTGTLAETQDDQTVAAVGIVHVFGTLNTTQEDQSSVGAGTFTRIIISGSDLPIGLRRASTRSRRTARKGWKRPPSWR